MRRTLKASKYFESRPQILNRGYLNQINPKILIANPTIVAITCIFAAYGAACAPEESKPMSAQTADSTPSFTAPTIVSQIHELSIPRLLLGPKPVTTVTASETDRNYDLFNIGAVVRLSDGSLVVASTQGPARLYDKRGKFVTSIGPGAHVQASATVAPAAKTIVSESDPDD